MDNTPHFGKYSLWFAKKFFMTKKELATWEGAKILPLSRRAEMVLRAGGNRESLLLLQKLWNAHRRLKYGLGTKGRHNTAIEIDLELLDCVK